MMRRTRLRSGFDLVIKEETSEEAWRPRVFAGKPLVAVCGERRLSLFPQLLVDDGRVQSGIARIFVNDGPIYNHHEGRGRSGACAGPDPAGTATIFP